VLGIPLVHERRPTLIEGMRLLQIIHHVTDLRMSTTKLRRGGKTIAFVPTMGALHDGHMALIEKAKTLADHVAASIFVNPKQFGPKEDLSAYPRAETRDAKLLRDAGVALLWLPTVETMYGPTFVTNISVSKLDENFCGAARPGHFDGVATVVAKLFNQVRPDIAVFGEKDWQQLSIIRQMALDLDFGIDIVGLPTQRAEDGLALSSRNAYLTDDERRSALALPRALGAAAKIIEDGGDVEKAVSDVCAVLTKAGFDPIDYVALVDATTLEPMHKLGRPARLLAAARMGKTRLIDNLPVTPRWAIK
jgi:pantoate--beta-alanine ligase